MIRHVGQATLILNNPDLVRTKQPATEVVDPGEAGVIAAEVEVEVTAEVEVEVLVVVREAAAVAEGDRDSFFIGTSTIDLKKGWPTDKTSFVTRLFFTGILLSKI
jgi:hypothetical protein